VRVCNVSINMYIQPFDFHVYEQITAKRVLYRCSRLIKCIDLIFLKSTSPPPPPHSYHKCLIYKYVVRTYAYRFNTSGCLSMERWKNSIKLYLQGGQLDKYIDIQHLDPLTVWQHGDVAIRTDLRPTLSCQWYKIYI